MVQHLTSKDRKSIVLDFRHDVKEFNQDIYDSVLVLDNSLLKLIYKK